jgi:death on curing protein
MIRKYLTIEQVIAIHKQLVDEFGGSHEIRDNNALEAAIMRPQIGYYETLHEQAAALMESLANNHAFIDGNKRIAFFATDTFLRLNGYWINCDNEVTHSYFMMLFETNTFRFYELLNWLDINIQPIEIK